MSRTYRKYPIIKYHWKGELVDSYNELYERDDYDWGMGASLTEIFDVKSKDSKPWFKPNKSFKIIMKKSRRAKEKNAIINQKEIPEFKKEDVWNWN